MKFDGAAKLLVINNEVYHEGHKPTYSELGTWRTQILLVHQLYRQITTN